MKEYKDGKYTIREYSNGNKHWFLNGELHREDGPAIEYSNGDKEWYLNGKRHREDGPAMEWSSGSKFWYLNGKHHREDGPAIEWTSGNTEWHLNGKRHREDGPAVEWSSGSKYWYLNGKKIFYFEYKILFEDWIEIPDLKYIGPFKRISDVFIELPIEIKKNKLLRVNKK